MSREEALKKLGFASDANPTKEEISKAHSAKIVSFRDLPQQEKVNAIVEVSLALGELRKNTSAAHTKTHPAEQSKSAKINLPWLLIVAISFTLAIALATFLAAYWLMPLYWNWGLSKVSTAFALSSIAASGSVLFFAGIALVLAVVNKIATRKYDAMLSEGLGITGKMLHALELGLKAKAWKSYFSCITEWDTYQNPLAFRAGVRFAVEENKTKIAEIEQWQASVLKPFRV